MFYVYCRLGGGASDGITAVEFAVAGIPEGWIASVIPAPSYEIMLWNPVQGGGTIKFSTCQTGDADGRVFVCTIAYYAPETPPDNVLLSVTKNKHRHDPNYQCPLVKTCDPLPAELRVCATTTDAILNGPTCTVAVVEATWSTVKRLYD
jgi:hypothetical protein